MTKFVHKDFSGSEIEVFRTESSVLFTATSKTGKRYIIVAVPVRKMPEIIEALSTETTVLP